MNPGVKVKHRPFSFYVPLIVLLFVAGAWSLVYVVEGVFLKVIVALIFGLGYFMIMWDMYPDSQ
jgi:hypothetical protein